MNLLGLETTEFNLTVLEARDIDKIVSGLGFFRDPLLVGTLPYSLGLHTDFPLCLFSKLLYKVISHIEFSFI